jgi:hypothetical protein
MMEAIISCETFATSQKTASSQQTLIRKSDEERKFGNLSRREEENIKMD